MYIEWKYLFLISRQLYERLPIFSCYLDYLEQKETHQQLVDWVAITLGRLSFTRVAEFQSAKTSQYQQFLTRQFPQACLRFRNMPKLFLLAL